MLNLAKVLQNEKTNTIINVCMREYSGAKGLLVRQE